MGWVCRCSYEGKQEINVAFWLGNLQVGQEGEKNGDIK
jgi:hypothetical protein